MNFKTKWNIYFNYWLPWRKKSIITAIECLLSKMGIIPYIKMLKRNELKELIKKYKFSIIDTQTLYDSPPNYFIVARKV